MSLIADVEMGCSDLPSRQMRCPAFRSTVCRWPPAIIFYMFCFSCRKFPHLMHFLGQSMYGYWVWLMLHSSESFSPNLATLMGKLYAQVYHRSLTEALLVLLQSCSSSVPSLHPFPSFHSYWSLINIPRVPFVAQWVKNQLQLLRSLHRFNLRPGAVG